MILSPSQFGKFFLDTIRAKISRNEVLAKEFTRKFNADYTKQILKPNEM